MRPGIHILVTKLIEITAAGLGLWLSLALFGFPGRAQVIHMIPHIALVFGADSSDRHASFGLSFVPEVSWGNDVSWRHADRFECRECGHIHWTRFYESVIEVNGRIWTPPWARSPDSDDRGA